jgi:lathosterol oxidase
MDTVVEYSDQFFFDGLYAKVWPAYTHTQNNTFYEVVSSWPREDPMRVYTSVYIITCVFGWLLYFLAAAASYYLVFDKDYMKHPKYLKNQIKLEIECAVSAIPWMTRAYRIYKGKSLFY